MNDYTPMDDDDQAATRGDVRRLGHELRTEMRQLATELRTEMSAEIARHTRASAEWIVAQIRAVDDQYRDLPERVAKLEARAKRTRRAAR